MALIQTFELPNILWLFSDQHRPQAIHCYGDDNIETPNLDRLAAEGIRFTNAYANTPLCTPFRASLYTGKYATSHGAVSLHRPPREGQRMLAQELRDLGYHTSHMGKWHISGGAAPCHFVSPYFRPGWEEWMGWECSNEPWGTRYSTGTFPLPVRTMDGYQTDVLADLTIDWLRNRSDEGPWFHVLSMEAPHPPHTAPDKFVEMFKEKELQLRPNVPVPHPKQDQFVEKLRLYYAQIANLDFNIGRILEALEETGQLDNTIIFYFSDHGELMGSHGRTGKGRPEVESSQIPLLIRYPDMIPAGQVSEGLISGVDLMPTLLGLIGARVPAYCEGINLSAMVCGERQEGADCVLLQYENTFWDEKPEQTFRALVKDDWMYTCFLLEGPTQLFHLREDPYQLHNRICDPSCQTLKHRMHEALTAKLDCHNDDFLQRMRAKNISTKDGK